MQHRKALAMMLAGCVRSERAIRTWEIPAYLRNQLLRAVNSVGANMAEGYGRGNGQQLFFYRMARGSAVESLYHLAVADWPSEAKRQVKIRMVRVCRVLARVLAGR